MKGVGMGRKALVMVVIGVVLGVFTLVPSDATTAQVPIVAKSAFLNGFADPDHNLPTTASVSNAGASIAKFNVGPGRYVAFASITVGINLATWSGIVTCVLFPPGANDPAAKAEYQFVGAHGAPNPIGLNVNTLNATTTGHGPGTFDFHCTDESGTPGGVTYRFLQLTTIKVDKLVQIHITP